MHRLLAAFLLLTACATDTDPYDGEEVKSDDGKADSSALGVFLDATFDGKVAVDSSWDDTHDDPGPAAVHGRSAQRHDRRRPRRQGRAHEHREDDGRRQDEDHVHREAAGRLEQGERGPGDDRFYAAARHRARRPGSVRDEVQAQLRRLRRARGRLRLDVLLLPPEGSGCTLAATDVGRRRRRRSRRARSTTTGKFPEYNKIWEDNTLKVVAIFGKYEDGATAGDAGIDGFNEFVASMKSELGDRTASPRSPRPSRRNPGVAAPDIEFNATLADGKKVHVVALLTDNVNTGLSQPAFRSPLRGAVDARRLHRLQRPRRPRLEHPRARAAGKWVAGQYVVVFMNGCDTFAYVDGSLSQAHKALNPDDTTGTKYIDIVNNAMPAFFASMSGATMALFRGFLVVRRPEDLRADLRARSTRSQVVLVTGEQDNTFTPGGGGQPQPWAGLERARHGRSASVEKRYETPTLAAGTYAFDHDRHRRRRPLRHASARRRRRPRYDCRPYKTGSNETCTGHARAAVDDLRDGARLRDDVSTSRSSASRTSSASSDPRTTRASRWRSASTACRARRA